MNETIATFRYDDKDYRVQLTPTSQTVLQHRHQSTWFNADRNFSAQELGDIFLGIAIRQKGKIQ